MGIKAVGANHVYMVFIHATSSEYRDDGVVIIHHKYCQELIAADSEDEARGVASRAGDLKFPDLNGWGRPHIVVRPIDGIESVGRLEDSAIKAAPRPW